MSRHELARRSLICLTLISILALPAGGARAEMPAMHQRSAPMMSASAMSTPRPASALDPCVPCAYCYMAPAVAMQGFRAKAQELGKHSWPSGADVPHAEPRRFNEWRSWEARVPIRMALCRWTK